SIFWMVREKGWHCTCSSTRSVFVTADEDFRQSATVYVERLRYTARGNRWSSELVGFLTRYCERFCATAIILTSRLGVGDSLTVGHGSSGSESQEASPLAATALVSEFIRRFLQVGFQRV